MQAAENQPHKPFIILGIVLTLLLMLFALLPFVYQLFNLHTLEERFLFSRLLFCCCALFVWYYCNQVEKRPLLLWPEKRQPFWFYLLSVVAIYLIVASGAFYIKQVFVLAGIKTDQAREKQLFALMKGKYWLIIIASTTAAFTEELIFRAYLISRMAGLFGSQYAAVFVSSVLFGFLHFGYHNWLHVAVTFFIGLVCALHYVLYRNIKALILFHFLYDFVIMLVAAR